jgi:hypothetical protein
MEGRLVTLDDFLQVCRQSRTITPALGRAN